MAVRPKSENWKLGEEGEYVVFVLLRTFGYHLRKVPSYKELSSAPVISHIDGDVVLPDIELPKEEAYTEVKSRTEACEWKNMETGEIEHRHAIKQRLWKHYERCEEITGYPVYIALYERSSGEVLFEKLSSLEKAGELTGERAEEKYDEDVFFVRKSDFSSKYDVDKSDGEVTIYVDHTTERPI
jgi:hypothetical protein